MHNNELCAPANRPTGPAAVLRSKKHSNCLIVNCMAALMMLATLGGGQAFSQTPGSYQVTNILSDGYVPATVVDSNFVDPWGISFGKSFWIDTAVTGYSYVTLPNGTTAFKAVIPAVSSPKPGQPTGTVFNSTPGFALSNGSPASFLFASLDGTIWGWNGKLLSSGNISLLAVNIRLPRPCTPI